jgi:hypothetical protein
MVPEGLPALVTVVLALARAHGYLTTTQITAPSLLLLPLLLPLLLLLLLLLQW